MSKKDPSSQSPPTVRVLLNLTPHQNHPGKITQIARSAQNRSGLPALLGPVLPQGFHLLGFRRLGAADLLTGRQAVHISCANRRTSFLRPHTHSCQHHRLWRVHLIVLLGYLPLVKTCNRSYKRRITRYRLPSEVTAKY